LEEAEKGYCWFPLTLDMEASPGPVFRPIQSLFLILP
jgi:hypothetical protein